MFKWYDDWKESRRQASEEMDQVIQDAKDDMVWVLHKAGLPLKEAQHCVNSNVNEGWAMKAALPTIRRLRGIEG